MINSKVRAKLRSLAQNVQPSVTIGKEGVTSGVLAQLDMNLKAHELVKIDVLENADIDKKALLEHLSIELKAEPVCVIGRKVVLYRFSHSAKNHVLGE